MSIRDLPTNFIEANLRTNPSTKVFSWGDTRIDLEQELERRKHLVIPPVSSEVACQQRHVAWWQFEEYILNGRYPVMVPNGIVSNLPELEKGSFHEGRLESMVGLLTHSDVYFDIGAEMGWLSAIIAQWVGSENMCLFEPTEIAWPVIKEIWDENKLDSPRSSFCGFVGNNVRGWPFSLGWSPATRCKLVDIVTGYRSLKDCEECAAITTLDHFVEKSGIVPTAIGMNIEGAEALALRGGEGVFRRYHPTVWVGMHVNNGSLAGFGSSQEELIELMKGYGYGAEFLGCSYEHWWMFKK